MANPEIVNFIKQQFAAGYSEQQIREALKSKGHPDSDIDSAFFEWKADPALPQRSEIGSMVSPAWEIYRKLLPRFLQMYWKFLQKASLWLIPGLVVFIAAKIAENAGYVTQGLLTVPLIVLTVALVIYSAYMFIWSQVAFLVLIKHRNEEMSNDIYIDDARPMVRPYFATSILTGIMTILWTLLFIIPGIIFGVYYTFAEYIVVDKGVKGWAALQMSKSYVKGLWWPVVWSLLGLIAISVLIYVPTSLIPPLFSANPELGQWISNIVSFAVNIFFAPYSLVYMYLVYEKLKSLKPEVS